MTTNLSQEFRTISYLSHLILKSDKEKLEEAVSQENWDIKNVNVRLFLDDREVRNEKIEPILKDWARRSYEQKIEQDEKKLNVGLKLCRIKNLSIMKLINVLN